MADSHVYYPTVLDPASISQSLPPDDSELDDEVDQLDSDSEIEDDASETNSGSKRSQSSRRSGERVLGQTLLPATRLENIMQADGVTGNLSLSKEAQFVLSIATEEFIKRMAQAGQRQATTARRSVVNFRDMASTTQQYQEFMFLQDTIPYPISLSEALQKREEKEKELFDINPAISNLPPSYTPASNIISGPSHSLKVKGKSRITNGKERQTNGNASVGRRESRKRDNQGRWSQSNGYQEDEEPNTLTGSRAPRRGRDQWEDPAVTDLAPGSTASQPQAQRYSHPSQIVAPPYSDFRPAPPNSEYDDGPGQTAPLNPLDVPSPSPHPFDVPPHNGQEPQVWPGQFSGPASAFLQDTRAPFRVSQNPGRTIYSPRVDPGSLR